MFTPGPHDLHNAGSVKLAEATRVRLFLPGLTPATKDPSTASSKGHEASTSTSSKSRAAAAGADAATAAAASAKARKKLAKLQRIASQASSAGGGGVIVEGDDDDVLGSPDSGCGGDPAGAASCEARHVAARKPGGGAAAASPSQGAADAVRSGKLRARSLTAVTSTSSTGNAEGASQGTSRLVDGTAGSSTPAGMQGPRSTTSSSGSPSSSRRGSGNKHVPIWERSQPTTPAESRRAAAAAAPPQVMQPVALRTFSPTLGSLGATLTAELARPDVSPGGGISRSKSAARIKRAAAAGAPGGSSRAAAVGALVAPSWSAAAVAAVSLGLQPPCQSLRSASFTATPTCALSPAQLLERLILRP